MIEYKKINKNEFERLAKLRWLFKYEENPNLDLSLKDCFIQSCEKSLNSEINQQLFTHFGAFLTDGSLISMASIFQVNKIPSPEATSDYFGYLTNVFTLPEYRNKGIGTQLLKKVQQWAAKIGHELLMVWPSEDSKNFYHRLDFAYQGVPLIFPIQLDE